MILLCASEGLGPVRPSAGSGTNSDKATSLLGDEMGWAMRWGRLMATEVGTRTRTSLGVWKVTMTM